MLWPEILEPAANSQPLLTFYLTHNQDIIFLAEYLPDIIYSRATQLTMSLSEGLEAQFLEVPCTRGVGRDAFTQGVQDFPFSVGTPNVWYPKKSYFKIEMSLYAAGGAELPLTPAALTAFADNAAGNLYDNVYFRGGEQDMSSLTQYCAQASALKVRLGRTLPWLKSMGAGTAINEASFMKRVMAVSQYPGGSTEVSPNVTAPTVSQASMTNIGAYDDRDIYKPVTTAGFAAATVSISPLDGTAAGAAVAFPIVQNGGIVTGSAETLFLSGMPQGSNPSGGPVLPGDLLVVNGVAYELAFQANQAENKCYIKSPVSAAVAATTNWFIVRSDTIRASQSFNKVFALWQPPIGIFDYDEELGSGNFRIQLNPNSSYTLNAVETKNPSATLPYRLVVDNVLFYAYIEKKSLPDSSRDLFLNEMSIQSKPYNNNLQFSVPPSTHAISIFVQDGRSGSNPRIPPSMFKVLDNGDLYLQNIQLNYASITKPSTNWKSVYQSSTTSNAGALTRSSTLELQQRYHDTYEESGLEVELGGMETLTEWLRRGPFYHFTFARDVNNKSTEVQLNTVFSSPAGGSNPTADITASRVFIVAHYRNTVQIVTANGLIVSVAQRAV
jgi:hypothetical protein